MSPVRSRRTAWDECEAVDGCAERHCSGEEQRGGRLDRERGDGGAGAQADKAPAYAEQGGTAEEALQEFKKCYAFVWEWEAAGLAEISVDPAGPS